MSVSEWSAPMNVGAPINVPGVTESNPHISKDDLSLYFDSDRIDLGTQGARDIFVSRRDCRTCPWQIPRNLGANINTPYVEGAVALSDDGHFLFFGSHAPTPDCRIDPTHPPADPTRPCLEDIWVAARNNPNDDLGWGPPVRLGPEINTATSENEPEFQRNADAGGVNLYFTRNRVAGNINSRDLFRARLRLRGVGPGGEPQVDVIGDPEPVTELNAMNVADFGMTIRSDGKEIFFFAAVQRGGVGALDLWSAVRQNSATPWGQPFNALSLNSRNADESPSLSHDGLTLYFASARIGAPARDIWMSTRTHQNR